MYGFGVRASKVIQSDSRHNRFLDALFIALDACFRLKRRNISSHSADPGLSRGYSYFVEVTKFEEHLEDYKDEAEPVCLSLD